MLQLLAVEPAVADIEYAASVSQLEASEFYHIYLRKIYIQLVLPIRVIHSMQTINREVEFPSVLILNIL